MKIESDKDVLAADAGAMVRSEQDRIEERQPRMRIPFGVPRAKMSVIGEIPGYALAWINDVGSRIHEARLGGYDFVRPTEITVASGAEVVPNGALGDRISIVAFKKTGERAYLMKIRREHLEENQQILRKTRETRLESIKGGRAAMVDKNFYIPQHSPIKISHK